MRCIAIRHVAFEDLGSFEHVLKAAHWDIDYVQAGVDELPFADVDTAQLMVVLGGPIGVNDIDAYPFLAQELELIRARIRAGRPLLGICLGAQLIAAAFGASVYPAPEKEIGWGRVSLTAAGRDSPCAALIDAPVLHWHGDTFDLPAGAELLASTTAVRNQAYAVGSRVLGLQFHVEADAAKIESWLIGHACELAQAGIDPRDLRAGAAIHGAAARRGAGALLTAWLRSNRLLQS